MRWGNLLPLVLSLPWLLELAIAVRLLFVDMPCSFLCGEEIVATGFPVLVLAALLGAGICFSRRIRGSGWALIVVSVLSLLAFPYHHVWLTGGV